MSIGKRIIYAVTRNPARSILLFFVVFFISNFLMIGIASKTAGVTIQNQSKQSVGASFRLELNEHDRRRRLDLLPGRQLANGSWTTDVPNNEFESLLIDDINKIAAVNEIKSYNITTRLTPANPINFQRIEDSERDQSSDFGGVTLYGNLDTSRDFNVLDGNIELIEGLWISSDSENVVIISKELSELNGLKLGNEISFNSCYDPTDPSYFTAKIVGIFKIVRDIPTTMSGDTFRSENAIFTNLSLPEKVEGHEGDPCYKYATFQVEDVNSYDETKDKIESLDIKWERYDFIDNNGVSQEMAKDFTSLDSLSTVLLVIVLVSGVLILTFIFTFWLRNRSYEIGILMALGKGRGNIIVQIIGEAILISMFALFMAVSTAPFITNAAVTTLVLQQQEKQNQKAEAESSFIKESGNVEEGENEIKDVSVTITWEIGVLVVIITVGMVSMTLMVVGAFLMKKKPMQILSDIE